MATTSFAELYGTQHPIHRLPIKPRRIETFPAPSQKLRIAGMAADVLWRARPVPSSLNRAVT